MTLHIEGMGWLGSLIAARLHRDGYDFTWHDTETPIRAWRASTGLVSPDGDDRSRAELDAFNAEVRPLLGDYCEPVTYCYSHKNPPHSGVYPTQPLRPGLTAALTDAYVVDVPGFVHATRRRHTEQRTEGVPRDAHLVIQAHSGGRTGAQIWGWSALAQLHIPADIVEAAPNPVFYGRVVRRIAYAYPLPGTKLHRIGSTMVRQTQPKPLDAVKHLHRWSVDFANLFPSIRVDIAGEPVQGWRPSPRENDSGGPEFVQRNGGPARLTMPPLAHSGVRWSPSVLRAAYGAIQGVI